MIDEDRLYEAAASDDPMQLAILNAIHQQPGTDTGHRNGYYFTIFRNVRLIRSPTSPFGFRDIVLPVLLHCVTLMMSVPLETKKRWHVRSESG
jgi:hypothetical protein